MSTGSASTLLDANGNIATNGEQRYYPFGEKRITTAVLPTDHLFTGQRELPDLGGIYYYGARFYSKLGRFLSADTIVPDAFIEECRIQCRTSNSVARRCHTPLARRIPALR